MKITGDMESPWQVPFSGLNHLPITLQFWMAALADTYMVFLISLVPTLYDQQRGKRKPISHPGRHCQKPSENQ